MTNSLASALSLPISTSLVERNPYPNPPPCPHLHPHPRSHNSSFSTNSAIPHTPRLLSSSHALTRPILSHASPVPTPLHVLKSHAQHTPIFKPPPPPPRLPPPSQSLTHSLLSTMYSSPLACTPSTCASLALPSPSQRPQPELGRLSSCTTVLKVPGPGLCLPMLQSVALH
ncbi:hypothetical protein B0J13DRAFT_229231 [Dactylonectria estremocensis]|uniref:Uncharacterized protein n=1 Tax=Dactylonectria estremocensis TaxID=1079267 RepID=A0A9P9F4Y3_9HYPO|nr:hypothetical protein B0J13DRAFT_229231 [Dactylonectria estremocensis]